MQTVIANMGVTLLGDPHLGRSFVHGVPLDRRGDREKSVWVDFQDSLLSVNRSSYHICMGDLFDKHTVSPTVFLQTYLYYKQACERFPNVKFVVIKGNHDDSRDIERKSSFDVFLQVCWDIPNLYCISRPTILDGKFGFIPWDPFKTAQEQAELLKQEALEKGVEKLDAVFGHWDIKSFGGDDHNLIPLQELRGLTKTVYTGHYHLPEKFRVSFNSDEGGWTRLDEGNNQPFDLSVIVTGSMQPYAHGEDPTGDLYVTHTAIEVEQCLTVDSGYFRNKVLRVLLQPGESFEETVDCLQFSVKRVTNQEEEEDVDVSIGDFEFMRVFDTVMVEFDVPQYLQDELKVQYKTLS